MCLAPLLAKDRRVVYAESPHSVKNMLSHILLNMWSHNRGATVIPILLDKQSHAVAKWLLLRFVKNAESQSREATVMVMPPDAA